MKTKRALRSVPCICGILLLILLTVLCLNSHRSSPDSWIGVYRFEEFAPPNIGLTYIVTIYREDDVLYARIKIDGFQTLTRLRAKLWNHGDELLFEFCDYYTDDKGNTTEYETYMEGDILFKMKKQKDSILTEWEELTPKLDEVHEAGEYFKKLADPSQSR